MIMDYPKNQLDALTQALVLSVSASDDARSQMALELAESFTVGLNDIQVASCKRRAEEILKEGERA
jgi:hypothetical protein